MATNYSNDVLRTKPDFKTVIAAETLKLEDNGKTILLGSTSGAFTVTLPDAIDGLRFKFVVSTVSSAIRTISATSAVIQGTVIANGASVAGVDETNIALSASSKVGDTIELISDGTNFYLEGTAQGATVTLS
jgi:hypothetical protein